jgi:galactokinase
MASEPVNSPLQPEALRERFRQIHGNATGVCIARAPGRVNLLGDHTDYNDGFVLPMTVDRGVYYALRQRADTTVWLHSLEFGEEIRYPLEQRPAVAPGAWTSYVTGAIEELRQRGLVSTGFEGVVSGDVPLGGGLSSSAALEVATVVALQALLGFELDAVDTARLCQQVEHRYAGVQCGIMDQFAARLGRENHALFLDCRSLRHEDIPLSLGEINVIIINTGVKRALAGSKYNERRHECQQGVDYFHQFDPSVAALRDVTPDLLAKHGSGLPENVQNRCRHVVMENQRVLDATALLRHNDLAQFGRLMNDSHASLRDLYEVSCPELDALVEIGQGTDGVLGARMTGAGFGGCTVHLAKKSAISALEERIGRLYSPRFGLEPDIYVLARNLQAGPVTVSPAVATDRQGR